MEHPSITSSIDDAANEAFAEMFPSRQDTKAPAPEEEEQDDTDTIDVDEGIAEEGDDSDDEERKPLPESVTFKPIADALKTEFVAYDAEGNPVEAIPNMVIEYKANGKIRKDRIDQVVKMAQLGVYNRDREEQYVEQQKEVEGLANQAITRLETRESQLRQLLEDPDVYEQVRNTYLAENEPEKRAERAERETAQVRASVAEEQANRDGTVFYEERVLPVLDAILTEFPEVEPDELIAQFTFAMQPVLQDGRIPRERFASVAAYVESELADWAKAKHERRLAKVKPATEAAQKSAIQAAKAKRAQAAASAPARGVGASSSKKKAPASSSGGTVQDAENDALNTALAGFI
jgi:hypothetical protein